MKVALFAYYKPGKVRLNIKRKVKNKNEMLKGKRLKFIFVSKNTKIV